jgi:Fe-coproporphyrin III synthase
MNNQCRTPAHPNKEAIPLLKALKSALRSTSDQLARSAKASIASRRLRPTSAILFLTYRCTSRCVGCNMWQRPTDRDLELTWEDWLPVMENLAASGVSGIELFGGDALLRKDALIPMIRFCREHGIQTYLPTSSSALTEQTVKELVDAGLNVIYLSFDEVPEIDGAIRGTERHSERVLRAMDWLQSARQGGEHPRIECITTISALNWRHLPTLLSRSRDHGAAAHHLWTMSEFPVEALDASTVRGIAPNPYFMSTDGRSHKLTQPDAEALWQLLYDIRSQSHIYSPMSINMATIEHLEAHSLASLEFPWQKCLFCTNKVVVSPFGDVMPCTYYGNYVLGNLRDRKLDDIWGNEAHRVFTGMQHAHELRVCDYCSLKFVHRPFMAALRNEARRLRE